VFAPPPPPLPIPEVSEPSPLSQLRGAGKEEKPRIQVREVADRAMTEIKTVPPQLMMYALLGAGVLILMLPLPCTSMFDRRTTILPPPHVRPRLPLASIPLSPDSTASPSRGASVAEPEPEVTVRQLDKPRREMAGKSSGSCASGNHSRVGADRLHSTRCADSTGRQRRPQLGHTIQLKRH